MGTAYEDLDSLFDGPDYIEETFKTLTGKDFKCKLAYIHDADVWSKLSTQIAERQRRAASKAGLTIKLPDGEAETIHDPEIASVLTMLEYGVLEPKLTFGEWAKIRHKAGATLMQIATRLVEMNYVEGLEEAKKGFPQATGGPTPESPA